MIFIDALSVLRGGKAARARSLFNKALGQIERARDIVAGLQSLSEKGAGRREPADLLEVIDEALALALANTPRPGLRRGRSSPPERTAVYPFHYSV